MVRACVEQGRIDEATHGGRRAAGDRRARRGTGPLRALASLAAGLVAARIGRSRQSREQHLEDAVDLFEESGAPFETGRARIELARVLGALGRATPPPTKRGARSTI